MGAVYLLTLRQLSGRWRLLVMTVLAALPVIITQTVLMFPDAPSVSDFEMLVLSTMLAGSITPLVVLAIAAPAFANELEDRTIANLTLSPVSRWHIALPKLLAAITLAGPFAIASALITSRIAYLGDPTATVAVTVGVLVGVAVYASAFVWLGLVTTQAIGIGLLYIVLWEGFFTGYVAGARIFSIRYLAIALIHGLDPRRFAQGNHLSLVTAVVAGAVLIGGFLWLAVRRLRRMDVP